MRIVCPICSAAYDVRDDLLSPGRIARCVRCGEEWVPLSGEPDAAAESEPEPDPASIADATPVFDPRPPPRLSAMDRLASHPAVLPQRDSRLLAAWVVSLVLVLGMVVGLVAWRGAIMQTWPPSVRLYDAIGLGLPPG